jgi:DNA-binding beta-propeller fold protein YncE
MGTGAMGGMGGNGPTEPKALTVVAHGKSVSLVDVVNGQLEVISTATLPSEGLLGGHQIFNIILQPGTQRIYAASSNDCSEGDHWCWGNGRIDRFTFTQTAITYDGIAYNMNHAAFLEDGISCAEGTEEDTGYLGQEGSCQPNGMAFSSDGTRLYVDDDELDDVEIFSVNATTGNLSFIAEGPGGGTFANGLAAHPTEPYVYNGTRVTDVTDDVVTLVAANQGGNATFVVPGTPNRLVTTTGTTGVGVFDLTDPEAPAEISALSYSSNQVRHVTANAGLQRLVIVGQNTVRLLSFDGMALTFVDDHTTEGIYARQNRGVSLFGDSDQFAIVAFFRGGDGSSIQPGGAVLYELDSEDAEGPLVQKHILEMAGPARVALKVIAQ